MADIPVDHPVLFLIHRLSRSLLRGSMAYYLHEFKLGVPQVQILHGVGRAGPMASKQIADMLAMNKALVSRSLRELTDLGYIASTVDPADARLRVWTLTDAGHAFVQGARARRQQRQRKFLAGLSEEEQRLLIRVLDKLYASSEALHAEEARQMAAERRSRRGPGRAAAGHAGEVAGARPRAAAALSRST